MYERVHRTALLLPKLKVLKLDIDVDFAPVNKYSLEKDSIEMGVNGGDNLKPPCAGCANENRVCSFEFPSRVRIQCRSTSTSRVCKEWRDEGLDILNF